MGREGKGETKMGSDEKGKSKAEVVGKERRERRARGRNVVFI